MFKKNEIDMSTMFAKLSFCVVPCFLKYNTVVEYSKDVECMFTAARGTGTDFEWMRRLAQRSEIPMHISENNVFIKLIIVIKFMLLMQYVLMLQ